MFFKFGEFVIDVNACKLIRDGNVVNDDMRIVKTLQVLCESYPEYADKEHLLDEVWPDQVVTDWSLSKLISDIRQLLGDSGKDQEYIKTVRGKGFKLNVNVEQLAEPDATSRPDTSEQSGASAFKNNRLLVSVIFIVMIVGYFLWPALNDYGGPGSPNVENSIKQVAVLPVIGLSDEPVNDWIKFGVMSLVAEQLSSYSSLQMVPVANVISAASLNENFITLSDRDKFEQVCSSLGCTDLISIQYQVVDKLPTLSYRIIGADTSTSEHSASNPDVMDATMLLLDDVIDKLIPVEIDIQTIEQKLTQNTKADREFAMGIHELLSGDLQTARNYLNLAMEREPEFFWIQAYLAEVEYRAGNLDLSNTMIEQLDDQRLSAEQSYFLEHLFSNILYSQGALDESLATTRALTSNEFALKNPILLGNEYLNIGSSLQAKGNNPDAISALEKAKALYQQAGYVSGKGKVLFNLGNVYLTNSQPTEAINAYQDAREIFIGLGKTGFALMARHQIASTNLYLGNIQTAEGELRQLITAYRELGDTEGEYTAELDLANVSMQQSDYPEATLRIEALLKKLQQTQLSYLINHALTIATKCNLMIGEPSKAQTHFDQLQGQWTDVRPAFALIPAHLLHDSGNLQGALDKAQEIKASLAEQWTPAHQEIMDQIQLSVSSGAPQKLKY